MKEAICRHRRRREFHKMRPEQWWMVMQANLGSMFNVTRQVIEGMRARRFGRIVNISSVADESSCVTGATFDVDGGQYLA